jgi:hypothetical protein
MGFFTGLGKHVKRGALGAVVGGAAGIPGTGAAVGTAGSMQAEADATRLRLNEHTYAGVNRLPPPPDEGGDVDKGPGSGIDVWALTNNPGIKMPTEKPDPRAQWDDARGTWILWDPAVNDWVDL